ncbi:hypothetical protein OHA40_07205 [Nocardia sp. NBC_00508]|uniref:hypothetical protein n=1 Tax=Nocardia sp. NBC_00508 TaxID=2975992 RepID=UPI002E816B33|nr:hypothetical protein [Nocardia sp. NBC_00508]WUD67905.1 hypothetical protein OHA40_07205 [Nocardia sp. NBC_00508]
MRIIRPNDDNDDNDGQRRPDPAPTPTDPTIAGELFADEVEDWLAGIADLDTAPTAAPAQIERPAADAGPVRRAALTVVPELDDEPAQQAAAAVAPVPARSRAQTARRTAAASAVVVGAAVTTGWGEGPLVVGPLAVYGGAWVAYLWWNAAHRPPLPQAISTVTAGIGHAVAAVATAIVGLLRALVERLDRARTQHENNRTTTTTAAP